MLARSIGASFRAGLSMPTDKCVEYCVVFACDVGLLVLRPFYTDVAAMLHWCSLLAVNVFSWHVW
jgi:hypothetical protein